MCWLALVFPVLALPGEELPVRKLEPPRRGDAGEGPLDWVWKRVESRDDSWTTEQAAEAISARLKQVAAWFEDPSDEFPASLLAPGFRADAPAPTLALGIELEDGTRSWRVGAAPRRTEKAAGERPVSGLDAAAWIDDLRKLRAFAGSQIDKAAFKVFHVEPAPDAPDAPTTAQPRVRIRALIEVDGHVDRGGARRQLRSVWTLDWERVEEGIWQITRFDQSELEVSSLPRRPLVDVTLDAFGESTAFRGQLAFGVEHWRTRLDAASGIDVYGHQGLAVGDYDGDGLDDVYVPQPAGLPNRLFRNRGDGRFEDATATSGVDVLDVTGGSLFVDLDRDRDLDLVVVTSLEVLLFENTDGRFRRRAGTGLETSSSRSASTLGCSAADYDGDGDLDLYVFSYIFWAGGGSKLNSSYPWPYHAAENGAPNFLFRNEGDWRFRDVTAASGLDRNNRRFSLAASWCDYDDDGDSDLYVANDFGRNNLYRNDGNGRFEDVAEEAGVVDTANGMSVTWEDYDNDGRIDLYVGNMWSSAGHRIAGQPRFDSGELRDVYLRMARGNSLFRNLGDGRFEDVTLSTGTWFGRWAWSGTFLDVEGDGFEDLYVVNGFVTGARKDDL